MMATVDLTSKTAEVKRCCGNFCGWGTLKIVGRMFGRVY